MIEKAIAKISQEAESLATDPSVQRIAQHIIQKIKGNSKNAEKVLNESKTIKGAIAAMRNEASKRQVNGVGYISDEEGFKIIEKYFEIEMQPADELDLDALL